MMFSNHPFHLVTPSPWPMILSMSVMNLMLSMINWFNFKNKLLFFIMILSLILIIFQWWRDVIRESTFQGFHTLIILKMIKFSMILFIISELFFFISFFWTYIHSSISSTIEINMNWPPMSIEMFNPYNIPLLNSIILISSGFSITWSHYCLINNLKMKMMFSTMLTIFLGFYFSLIQIYEYYEADFCFNDSIFGSIFFMSTGFHGIHVFIGTLFICSCLIRMNNNHFSMIHHFNFEAASWYWHFVDIIWLILYILIYWWMN